MRIIFTKSYLILDDKAFNHLCELRGVRYNKNTNTIVIGLSDFKVERKKYDFLKLTPIGVIDEPSIQSIIGVGGIRYNYDYGGWFITIGDNKCNTTLTYGLYNITIPLEDNMSCMLYEKMGKNNIMINLIPKDRTITNTMLLYKILDNGVEFISNKTMALKT